MGISINPDHGESLVVHKRTTNHLLFMLNISFCLAKNYAGLVSTYPVGCGCS